MEVLDRPTVALHWAVSLVEPLLRDDDRAEARLALVRAVASDPLWGRAFFAGIATGLAQTLPTTDPWRDAASVIESGGQFGTVADVVDLIPPLFEDLQADPALAAVATPLSPETTKLLVDAFGARDAWGAALIGLAPGEMVRESEQVVRRLVFRRRSYVGRWDDHVVDLAEFWGRVAGSENEDVLCVAESMVSDERVADECYRAVEHDAALGWDWDAFPWRKTAG